MSSPLHDKLEALLPRWRREMQQLLAEHGEAVIGNVTPAQVLGGMRGLRGLVCDTSSVAPEQGLIVRGIPVAELADRDGDDMFWLLLTGELPTMEERKWLQEDATARREPGQFIQQIDTLIASTPTQMHPVTRYALGLMSLQQRSLVAARYGEVAKAGLWEPALEDALNLRAWAPAVVTRVHIDWGNSHPDPAARYLAWNEYAGYIAQMPVAERGRWHALLNLYAVVHCDHENGNASAFACHTVGSSLADPFLAVVASLNALAGPIHGGAAKTCLEFIQDLRTELGADASDEQVSQACWRRLNAKQIIPGFGHAVLRGEDPRFLLLKGFGDEHCADETLYRLASTLYRVATDVLREHGAAKSPYPNVDAIGGVLLWCCGLRYPEFYTIMFSLAQMNGLLANYVLARGLGLPIIRPRSVTLAGLRQLAAAQ